MSKKICVLGDSITEGYYDLGGGWCDRLKRDSWSDVDNAKGFYNLGVSGDNTDDLLKRIHTELKARIPELIIFAIGINDSQYIENENNPRISIEKFEDNLRKILKISKEYTKEVIFISLTNVVEGKTMPIPWSPSKFYSNSIIQKYNKILEEFCEKEKINFIPMFDLLDDEDLPDGLHPNSVGHQKMFERIKGFLEERVLTR